MRCLSRNKRAFWYALYEGLEPILDANGNETGRSIPKYSEPVKASGNISSAKGSAETEQFGITLQYDKVIIVDNTPIDENSVLYIDKEPDGAYDYIVKKVARSLNSVSIAVRKVDVS